MNFLLNLYTLLSATQQQRRCEACRTMHWCSHACIEAESATGGVHALLCPRLRRVKQRRLLKGMKGSALAVDGETIRLALQVGVDESKWFSSIDSLIQSSIQSTMFIHTLL